MGYNIDYIKSQFKKIDVDLEISKKPFGAGIGLEQIFAMDIRRQTAKSGRRSEYFVIYPGDEENNVNISAIDSKRSQLILTVCEPPRAFSVKVDYFSAKLIDQIGIGEFKRTRLWLAKVKVFKTADGWYYENKTPKGVRHYLLGVDERQLFMCQLRSAATSIEEAHDLLKPKAMKLVDGPIGKVSRQGEWFFLEPTKEELSEIEKYLKSSTGLLLKKQSINEKAGGNPAGKPHVADEVVIPTAERLVAGQLRLMRPNVYVRGNIRHPDHATIRFVSWRKVLLNTENRESSGRVAGSTWID